MPIPIPPHVAARAAAVQRRRDHIRFGTPISGQPRRADAAPLHAHVDACRALVGPTPPLTLNDAHRRPFHRAYPVPVNSETISEFTPTPTPTPTTPLPIPCHCERCRP